MTEPTLQERLGGTDKPKPAPVTVRLQVIKDGVGSDKWGERFTGEPPALVAAYLHKYITARFGRSLKITIEADDAE